MAIARQWHDKHVSAATNKRAAVEELLEVVFSMWYMLRLYNKHQLKASES
jgi:hypothetical protein